MKKLSDEVRAYMGQLGARGGKRAAAQLSPAQRKARATKASKAAAVARTKKRLAKQIEEATDLSDIPELSAAQLASMKRVGPGGVIARMKKKHTKGRP